MQILGIDFGLKKIGLAVSSDFLTEPYQVVRYISKDQVIKQIKTIIKKEKIEAIVVGVSEGSVGKASEKFGKELEKNLSIPVFFQDETLTTQQAQKLAIDAGVRRKKRKGMEDAYSAALILQAFLDK